MNSELEKLIEKYRITVNGLADLESGYYQVIKERGFVTLNGLLVEPTANTEENTSVSPAPSEPATESDASHNTDGVPVVPAENTPVAPAPAVPAAPAPSEPATEQPGVTPVVEGPVSGDTNLGNEVAGGERAAGTEEDSASTDEHNPSGEEETSEDSTTGRKPKKKATSRTAPSEEK